MTAAPSDPQTVVLEFFRDRLTSDIVRNGHFFHDSAVRVVGYISDEEIQKILDKNSIPKLESPTGFYSWLELCRTEFALAVEEMSETLADVGHTLT